MGAGLLRDCSVLEGKEPHIRVGGYQDETTIVQKSRAVSALVREDARVVLLSVFFEYDGDL